MLQRRMILCHLRPQAVERYLALHRAVWPELLALYRHCGIRRLECFLHQTQLLIYSEVEAASRDEAFQRIAEHALAQRWDAEMRALHDPAFPPVEFTEVFHLPPQEA